MTPMQPGVGNMENHFIKSCFSCWLLYYVNLRPITKPHSCQSRSCPYSFRGRGQIQHYKISNIPVQFEKLKVWLVYLKSNSILEKLKVLKVMAWGAEICIFSGFYILHNSPPYCRGAESVLAVPRLMWCMPGLSHNIFETFLLSHK